MSASSKWGANDDAFVSLCETRSTACESLIRHMLVVSKLYSKEQLLWMTVLTNICLNSGR